MKDFYEFKTYIAAKGNLVQHAIYSKVNAIMKKEKYFKDKKEEQHFYDQTVMMQTIMEMLEQYHKWVNMPEKHGKK